MTALIQAGVSVFGLFTMDPALMAFAIVFILFGALNLIDYKRID